MRVYLESLHISGTWRARWSWLWLVVLSTGTVQAQTEHSLELQLNAPPRAGCLDADALTALVEARLGRSTQAADGNAAARVEIWIEPLGHGYRASVLMSDARRELIANGDCSELDEMLVVVIASSLGITAQHPVQPRDRPERVAWQLAPPRATAAMSGSTRTPGEQTRPLPWQLDLGVSARVLTGITPQPAVGPGLAVLAQWGALALHVGSSWLPSRTYSARPALRISGHLAELGVCGRGAGVSQLLALFCVDMWAGALRASADPLQQPSPRWDGLLLLVPRVTGRFQLARSLGVAVGLGAAIPLILPRYAYGNTSGERVVAHTPELGVFLELALWLRIHP